jgi:hypothetical protein
MSSFEVLCMQSALIKKQNGRRNVFGRIVRVPLAAESLTGEVLRQLS